MRAVSGVESLALGPTVCVRKKIVYICDGFVDLLVSLQPLAVVLRLLRLLALGAQLAARRGGARFAVYYHVAALRDQNKRPIAPLAVGAPALPLTWARKAGEGPGKKRITS